MSSVYNRSKHPLRSKDTATRTTNGIQSSNIGRATSSLASRPTPWPSSVLRDKLQAPQLALVQLCPMKRTNEPIEPSACLAYARLGSVLAVTGMAIKAHLYLKRGHLCQHGATVWCAQKDTEAQG